MFIPQFKVHTASAIHRDKTEHQADILKRSSFNPAISLVKTYVTSS